MLMSCGLTFAQTDSSKAAAAPATPPATTFSGSVDAYYRANFNAPGGKTNSLTSFTNSNSSFELGMISLRADHSFGKVGVTADLGFGRRASEYSYNDTASHSLLTLAAVKQLYVTYSPSDKVKFTFGKWGTHVGYEVLDAYSNRNYSMDYMFSYGPFFHTGLKADITLSSTTAFMVGLANPTDFSTTTSGTKVFLAQFSTGSASGKFKAFLNYQGYGGVSTPTMLNPNTGYMLYKSLSQFDLVINGTLSSQVGIGFNGTVQSINDGASKSWWGSAVYLNYDPISTFGLTLRGEYFSDKDGLKLFPVDGVVGSNVVDFTLSGNVKIGALTLIPELRLDNGSENLFLASDGTATKSTFSALLAAVYKF